MSVFIIFVKCEPMTFLGILKIFTGISPGISVAFLGLKDLIILFISLTFAVGKSKFRVSFWLHLIFETLGGFSYFQKFCLQFLYHFLAKSNLQIFLVQYQMFYLFIYLFIYSFIYLFIYLFILYLMLTILQLKTIRGGFRISQVSRDD